MTIYKPLPEWSDYLAILKDADKLIPFVANSDDPLVRQEFYRLLFLGLSSGFQSAFMDPDLPDFVPMVNNVLRCIGTNPDFIYGGTVIDGKGTYRLSGQRGDGLLLLFDFVEGGLYVTEERGPSVGTLDVDTCRLDDGNFNILVSDERPVGYEGDWFRLHPRARAIMARQASYNWGEGREARLAIERIDIPIAPKRPDVAEIARRLELLAKFPERVAVFGMNYVNAQRSRGVINQLEYDDWVGRGGVEGQHYYQGLFKIARDEALLLETEVPEKVRYWAIQLNDPLWNAIDWINHQSSLNGGQARLDPDGRFRAVISLADPGVPNWLDPGGYAEGTIMLRWTQASSNPEPKLTLVLADSVRDYFPVDTPVVTPQMRQASSRERRRNAQLRRRW